MIITVAATIGFGAAAAVVVLGVVVPFTLGTIEWALRARRS